MLNSYFCLNLTQVKIPVNCFLITILFLLLGGIFSTVFLSWWSNPLIKKNNYLSNCLLCPKFSTDPIVNRDPYIIDWDIWLASETLTIPQLVQYFLWTNHSSCQLSHDFGGVIMKNPSGLSGQKAVCIDSKVAPKPGECLVYSFGINSEWSFDEAMVQYGCEVFAFDPSMGMDHHEHSPGVHFYNWGLGDQNEYDYKLNWTILSLSSIYENLSARHGSVIIDYLKIDIEYSEWIALPDIIQSGILHKVRQLGLEIHLDSKHSLEQHLELAKILRSIEKMGMVRFDSEYNPWYIGTFTQFPFTASLSYEIAWYNSNLLHEVS